MTRTGAMPRRWIAAAAVLWLFLVFAHVGLEWLFHATKVSFLSYLGLGERLWILALTPLPLVLAGWLALTPFGLLALLVGTGSQNGLRDGPRNRRSAWSKATKILLALLPAALLTGAAFLLLENFTVTVFGFGVLALRGPGRLVYGVLLFVMLSVALLLISDWIGALARSRRTLRVVWRLGAIAMAISVAAWLYLPWKASYGLSSAGAEISVPADRDLPDVFVISAEALAAEDFDLYSDPDPGPETDKISDLRRLADEGAAFENAFANADSTAGSVPTAATGRHPLTTRKLNGRHSLHGADSYRHLPAIMKLLGYRTFLRGANHHVDPASWNLRGGFDVYNEHPWRPSMLDSALSFADGRLDWTAFFFDRLWQRLRDRTLHAVGGELVEQPASPETWEKGDLFDGVREWLRASDGPVFVMGHLRGFGTDIERFVDQLVGVRQGVGAEERDFLLVVWSDHGPDHNARRRLPLVVRWPRETRRSQIPEELDTQANAQNLDIAPTILDALGVEIPEWMEGRSLLRPRSRLRPIFIVSSRGLDHGLPVLRVTLGGPKRLMVMVCQRRWELDLLSGRLEVADLEDHTAPCKEAELPDDEEAREMILDFLRQRGYQVELVPGVGEGAGTG